MRELENLKIKYHSAGQRFWVDFKSRPEFGRSEKLELYQISDFEHIRKASNKQIVRDIVDIGKYAIDLRSYRNDNILYNDGYRAWVHAGVGPGYVCLHCGQHICSYKNDGI